MDIFDVLTMLGGLALFLYGMNAMGDGLEKVSGGKLERILEKLTSNPIKAVLLGAGVTAVIQSSSATTVMVVGFVNSGIMKLSQAVGIIMGANVGTTATSWILSLTGIQGDSLFINLLKPTSFSPVLAVIGVVLLMFGKQERRKDIGNILIGFAILMFGMDTMSNAVAPLADVPEFTNILTMFSNPFLGMIAGAILTAVIQSSSASIGILQALCITGSITYGSAIPIIMGQNIGTCITAMLSSVGANKNAKRAALVHLYFNVIGTVVFMVLFYSINAFSPFAFLGHPANAAGIAVVHSCFNIAATLVLLPFQSKLEKLACLTIKDDEKENLSLDEKEKMFQLIDERFLDTPSFAIEQCRNLSVKMAEISKDSLYRAIDLLLKYDRNEVSEIMTMEEVVDRYEDELGTYLVKLSSKNLSEKDSRILSELLHCIGNFERISDHAVNLAETAQEINEKNLGFSNKANKELKIFSDAIKEIIDTAIRVFETGDLELAKTVEPLEEVVDYLNKEMRKRHIKRLRKGKCSIEMGFALTDVITNFERISDHCSNIAVCMIQVEDDGFETHDYMNRLDKGENTAFREEYLLYKQKYQLP